MNATSRRPPPGPPFLRPLVWALALLALLAAWPVMSQVSPAPGQPALASAWRSVESVLGRKGQLLPGDVFKVGMPRTDLHVRVAGVPVRPAFALGSWAAFKESGGQTMMMGDLVLLDREVNPVLTRLLAGGLEVTAIHNHLNDVTPHILYMHYAGHGDAESLARSLNDALGATGTPPAASGVAPPVVSGLDTQAIEGILGRPGKVIGSGVFQVTVPRAAPVVEHGKEIPPAMGMAMPLNFQITGRGRAAITGDLVLIADEVNPVARALRENDIDVTAIHNHGLGEEPRLFFLHFWAEGDALMLARGLRAALDRTYAAPATVGP
jgi:hypothetical protein